MTQTAPQPTPFRTGPLMAQVVGACVLGGLLGAGVAVLGGWGGGDVQTIATASVVSTTVWVIGGVIGVLLLGVSIHRQPRNLGPGVLASSVARMLVALFVGLLLYFLLSLEGRCFWTSFLLAGLFALVAETTWAVRSINAASHAAAGAP